MQKISQNRKVALSSMAVFVASFSFMLLFLGGSDTNLQSAKTDVLHSDSATSNHESTIDHDSINFITNSDGSFDEVSDKFCKTIARSCKLLVGAKSFDYISHEDLADFASIHAKLVQNGEKMDMIGPYRFISGSRERLLILAADPQKNKGKVTKIIFSATDLTDKMGSSESDDEKNWIEMLYPKIKNTEKEKDPKLLVDKISYKAK